MFDSKAPVNRDPHQLPGDGYPRLVEILPLPPLIVKYLPHRLGMRRPYLTDCFSGPKTVRGVGSLMRVRHNGVIVNDYNAV